VKQVFLPIVMTGGRHRATVCSRVNKARNQLNLATYNIGYSTNDSWVISRDRIATIVDQLEQGHDAEVVALQEVVQRDNRPEIQVFSNDHKDWWQFTAPHNEDQDYRNLILSAYPIVKGSERTHTIKSKKGKQDRVNLSVQVAHPSGTFRVFNVHTRYDEASEGVAQTMKWVRTITDQEKGMPFVVMGDFNDSGKRWTRY
jgi:endonuclease/exonuclease/phosphatase family metal-dependent hydrolase